MSILSSHTPKIYLQSKMTTPNTVSYLGTFRNEEYTITTSLSEHHIIINLINNVNYTCHEGRFTNSTFRFSCDNEAIFKLINKCFAEFVEPSGSPNPAYNVIIRSNETKQSDDVNNIIFAFRCNLEGFVNVYFDLRLTEKIYDNVSLTTELIRQKQFVSDLTGQIKAMERKQELRTANIIARQQKTIDGLLTRMEEMERNMKHIISGVSVELKRLHCHNDQIFFPLDSISLEIPIPLGVNGQQDGEWCKDELKNKIPKFYQLNHLIMHTNRNNWVYFKTQAYVIKHPSVTRVDLYWDDYHNGINVNDLLPMLTNFPIIQEFNIFVQNNKSHNSTNFEEFCERRKIKFTIIQVN